MMITFSKNNIFNIDVEALVNPVNCVGVMGKGLALEFKNRYSDNFEYYKEAYKNNRLRVGKCLVFETAYFTNPKYIINFPTKHNWKDNSRYEYIRDGLVDLEKIIKSYEIKSIAIPALGCGLGNLNWVDVEKLFLQQLSGLESTEIIIIKPKENN